MGRLIVVSNRLPVTLERAGDGWTAKASSGGLATAMDPILQQNGGTWIGWSGETEPLDRAEREALLGTAAKGYGYRPIDVDGFAVADFYEGFPNQTVWPLFHYFPSRMKFTPGSWEMYVEGNRRFCAAVEEEYAPGDLVWIHDYHLMLLPAMLREKLPDARIGFFLHIPFPSSELFSNLPRRDEVLAGLLGADLIAFHTHRHVHHFRSALLRILGIETAVNTIDYASRAIHLEAMPIGIAPAQFTELIESDGDTARHYADLRSRFEGQTIIAAVDRLDYTKGLVQRLRTYRRLLTSQPALAGKTVLIQIAVPSREGIDSYQELREEVNQLVGEINGKLGTAAWTPVVYINRGIPREELAALYKAADIAWVAPLRDGMNLVAKEYCVCKPQGDGVLILSEFAGAAAEMGEAFLVNPYDEERVAETLVRAMNLSEKERSQRMRALHARVVRQDVFRWAGGFVSALESLGAKSAPASYGEMIARFAQARQRVLLLDYDGTLVPHVSRPELAVPGPRVMELLRSLASRSENCVAVVSGRKAEDLEQWLGTIPRLILAGEHGVKVRDAPGSAWQYLRPGPHSTEWKQQVRPVLEHFVERTPGSFLEEKELALVWHFQRCEPEFAEWLASELVAVLEGLLANTEVHPVRGHKIVEVRPTWVNKGEFAKWMVNRRPGADLFLAAGDDRTDEDMFPQLPGNSITIHVGASASQAAVKIANPAAFLQLLSGFDVQQ